MRSVLGSLLIWTENQCGNVSRFDRHHHPVDSNNVFTGICFAALSLLVGLATAMYTLHMYQILHVMQSALLL